MGLAPSRSSKLPKTVLSAPNEMTGRLWRRHLVSAPRTVLGNCNGLTFVEHAEPVAFLDTEVLDIELRFVPLADVGTLVHDEGAEVAGVEHHDVGGLGGLKPTTLWLRLVER